MASLIKKCECADTKAGRTLDLRKADDRKTAERSWGKCGHSWVVRYRLGGRGTKQQEQSYPHNMKKDAEAFILEIKSDKVSGLRRTIDPKAGAITFADYADSWLSGRVGLSAKSVEIYGNALRNQINPTLGHLRLNAITRQTIKNFISALIKAAYAPNTIHSAYMVVGAIFSEATMDKLIPESPCTDIELPSAAQRQEFLVPSWTQISKLADSMPARWAATVWLMAGCGLRVSEAFAVAEEGVMFGGRRLRIHEQVTRKRVLGPLKHREEGDYRVMPLPPFVHSAITTHIESHGTADGYLFQAAKGGWVGYETYRLAFVAAAKTAGLPEDFTPHGLRHSYASMQLAQGIPITDVSRWLGHQDIGITFRTYGHLVDEAWDRALDAMEAGYQTGIAEVPAAAC
ncbi:tyrosine-type recombinase/integrase [Nonomuraea sp. NPDC003709]|uniref:tyrosine-type recombinase/integrase n=1 Tax=Nonomuraea sp. NPDC003709 TaxID=3154450 RepID=UPI00339EF40A